MKHFVENTYPLKKENPELFDEGDDPVLAVAFQEKKEDIIRLSGSNMEHRDE